MMYAEANILTRVDCYKNADTVYMSIQESCLFLVEESYIHRPIHLRSAAYLAVYLISKFKYTQILCGVW